MLPGPPLVVDSFGYILAQVATATTKVQVYKKLFTFQHLPLRLQGVGRILRDDGRAAAARGDGWLRGVVAGPFADSGRYCRALSRAPGGVGESMGLAPAVLPSLVSGFGRCRRANRIELHTGCAQFRTVLAPILIFADTATSAPLLSATPQAKPTFALACFRSSFSAPLASRSARDGSVCRRVSSPCGSRR
jgi:hypothetical protein